jgi:N-hydroxyarylamine O-acetyltransferase
MSVDEQDPASHKIRGMTQQEQRGSNAAGVSGPQLMTDDWAVSKLDLDAYLARIGYTGPAEPSHATLAALHRAHLAAIPFENLDIMLGRGVPVDLESIQAKLVHARRGGYCYEHGQLFGAALERLGFSVDRLLARVGPEGEAVRPRTHLMLRVGTGADTWLADVGFGSSPPAPLLLGRGPQEVDGWTYEVAGGGADGTWKLRELQDAGWVTLYRVEDQCVYPADVVMSNHFTSTYPESWFTLQPIVVRREPGAIRSLIGRIYTVTTPGHIKDRRTLTDAEFAIALTEVFGLTLTDEDLATLIAAPAARESHS